MSGPLNPGYGTLIEFITSGELVTFFGTSASFVSLVS